MPILKPLRPALLLGICFASVSARAEEPAAEKAKFRIGHHALTYSSSEITAEPQGGSSSTYTETALDTFAGGWEFYAFKAPYNLYVYPGQKNSTVVAGYSITPEIETGVSLNLQQFTRDKATGAGTPKTDSTTSLYGVYGTYYLALGSRGVLELTLNPVFGTKSGTDTDTNGAKTYTTKDLTQINAGALYDHALVENLHYYFHVLYSSNMEDDKEAKAKTTTNTTTVTPIGFRYYL